MVLNTHFHNYGFNSEQNLLEDLVIEYIQQFGSEIYYLPARRTNFDTMYHDDDLKSYDTAYPIEMYIVNVDGFGGDQIFASKFDIEVRDQMQFSIARRRFEIEIGNKENIPAPREDDLIYFPMNGKLFKILFSDNKPFFYQMGTLQMFNITVESFEYSSERFSTGIETIDAFQNRNTMDVLEYAMRDREGNYLIDRAGNYVLDRSWAEHIEDFDDSDFFDEEVADGDIIQFTEENPYSNRNPY